jgi:hypothetical protein
MCTLRDVNIGSPMVCERFLYHIFTTPYLFLLTLFFVGRDVEIHSVISKKLSHEWYHIDIKEDMW